MQRSHAIAVVTRLSERRPDKAFLTDALARRPDRLLEFIETAEIEPAPGLDAPLARIVAAWPLDRACYFHNRLPEHTTRLRETALAVTTACWRLLEMRAAQLPDATRGFVEIGNNLVARLAAVDALKPAAHDFRDLADAYPDAFLTDCASVYRSLALGRHRLGEPDEALAASAIAFDYLCEAASSSPKGLGAAQEALGLYLQLEPYRHLGQAGLDEIQRMTDKLLDRAGEAALGLVKVLIENGKSLSDQGRPEEGLALTRAAAGSARGLTQIASDHNALALLCTALVQSISIQARLGDTEGLEETMAQATTGLATLARGEQSDRGNAALLLNNLSNALSWLDRLDQAEAAAREAVRLLRPLAGQDPAHFEPGLAIALYNLARRLSGQATREEVAGLLAQARRLLAPHATPNPDDYGAWMTEIDAFASRLSTGD